MPRRRFSPFKAASFLIFIFAMSYFVYVNSPSGLMMSNAFETKAEISKFIPINSSIDNAKSVMIRNGYICKHMINTGYADYANESNKHIERGPANILYCDSGELITLTLIISKRWQVSFEEVDGKVSYIAVGVALTGP